jgi:hypothetical protein
VQYVVPAAKVLDGLLSNGTVYLFITIHTINEHHNDEVIGDDIFCLCLNPIYA